MVKIVTEKYDIIHSGSLIISDDDYCQFDILDLRFRFIFLNKLNDEKSGKDIRLEWHTEKDNDDNEFLLVSMINFAELENRTSVTEFLNLASHDGHRLLFNFTMEPLKKSMYLMNYTWYLEK